MESDTEFVERMTPLETILRNPPDTYPEWMEQIRKAVLEECKSSTGSPLATSSSAPSADSSTSPPSSANIFIGGMSQFRQKIEATKYLGPTIKLLALDTNLFAILDHEYNLVSIARSSDLPFICNSTFPHPPQRERPKPQLYTYDYETKPIPEINTEDLDI